MAGCATTKPAKAKAPTAAERVPAVESGSPPAPAAPAPVAAPEPVAQTPAATPPPAPGPLTGGPPAAAVAAAATAEAKSPRVLDKLFPQPAALDRDVNFWIRVYTEIGTNAGFLHDQYNLGVVYETLQFGSDTTARRRFRLSLLCRSSPSPAD